MNEIYARRLDALEQTWAVWARLGAEMNEEQWSSDTRCDGWDVAALYAHHAVFPRALTALPALPDGPAGEPVTAVDILRGFNAPDGVAHTMADTVADAAATDAAQHTRTELVERFTVHDRQAGTAKSARHRGDQARSMARGRCDDHAGGGAYA